MEDKLVEALRTFLASASTSRNSPVKTRSKTLPRSRTKKTMRSMEAIAKETLAARDVIDLAILSHRFVQILAEIQEHLLSDNNPPSLITIQSHPICKAWAQLILRATSASSGPTQFQRDFQAIEALILPEEERTP
jgi:hypothetical protein